MPAPNSVPPTAPVSNPGMSAPPPAATAAPDYMDANKLFDDLESQIFQPKDEQGPDFSKAKNAKDLDASELADFDPNPKEQTGEETQETTDPAATEETGKEGATEEAQPEFRAFEYEDEIGGKRVHLNIKTPEQMNSVIRRAVIAQDLYQENQELKQRLPELEEAKEWVTNYENLIENSPGEFIGMILEDMEIPQVKQLILALAEQYGQDDAQIANERKIKRAEFLEKKLDQIRQREEELEERRRVAAYESDVKALKSWAHSSISKLASRIPEQYHDYVKQQVRNTILESRQRQSKGERITNRTLDAILARNVRAVLDLAGVSKTIPAKADAKAGERIAAQKQQNLINVRDRAAAAQNTGANPPKTRMRQALEKDDIYGALDELVDLVDRGAIRLREG